MKRREFLKWLFLLGAGFLPLSSLACKPRSSKGKSSSKRRLSSERKSMERPSSKLKPQSQQPQSSEGEVPKEPPKTLAGIAQGPDIAANVLQAISLAGGLSSLVKPEQTVVVKPNLTTPARSGSGIVTHVEVARALIKHLKELGVSKIIVAEGPGGRGDVAWRSFEKAGYVEMAQELGAELVDLNAAPVEVKESPGLAFPRYSLPSQILQADVFINLAVLKTHNLTGVTLSLKNLFGVPPTRIYGGPREMFHSKADQVIVDLNSLVKSHFVIVDGTVGMEGYGPIEGEPVSCELVIASPSPVAADTVATSVMGFDPEEIGHLRLAAEKGLGTIDLNQIEVRGKKVAEVTRKFRPP